MRRISVHSLLKIILPLLLIFGSKQCYADTVSIPLRFYHGDHLGSASWITNGNGTPVQHLQYMPYGEPFVNERTSSSSYEERYTFTGKERDSETGFSYFGARYYDSDLMTGWISVDPLADSIPYASPYTYCLNNPIKLKDPNGEIPLETIWDIGNVLYDFGAAVTNHIKGNHNVAKSNWRDLGMDVAAVFIPYVPAGASKVFKATNILKGFKPLENIQLGGAFFEDMDEFYKSVVNLEPGERIKKYKEMAKKVADNNGWKKNSNLSKKNNRDIYTDSDGNHYSLDTRHGDFEIFDKRGKHQGAIKFKGTESGNRDKTRKHNIEI